MQTKFWLMLLKAVSDVARRCFMIRKTSIAWHSSEAILWSKRANIANVCFAAAQTDRCVTSQGCAVCSALKLWILAAGKVPDTPRLKSWKEYKLQSGPRPRRAERFHALSVILVYGTTCRKSRCWLGGGHETNNSFTTIKCRTQTSGHCYSRSSPWSLSCHKCNR